MRIFRIVFLFIILSHTLFAQKNEEVYVDKKGVMRWPSGKEVQGFGINYTVPFAHAYRTAGKLGINREKAIDNDVYHFARLGFDAYRIHVWDTEISDTLGNLLTNDHLKLFDYMISRMKERNMKFILTPIAFWGNGYPEPEEDTPGFSHKYGKDACLVNEDAIKAQANYLAQFLQHINPYTHIAYKDDPDIVAFEVSNEPHHHQKPEKVTKYIDRLVSSMRETGCKKPIFYNISHSIELEDAYFKAGIQGGTFQWYPTGLGSQEELGGNLLPNADKYRIPFADNVAFEKLAKIVYEFDAADVGRSYIYPAIARSFRTAGIQWATHFAYDPTFMAFANTEYNTHYMNLAYAPQKALSLKLASEVFHTIPMYKDYGSYPADTLFGPFHISYPHDLAEMITDKKFIYTNNTSSKPPQPSQLEEISGYGNSPVVHYEGRGAYFLDRLDKGVWRLELMPDAIWVKDPFGRNSLDNPVAVINWRRWPMTLYLPDLGDDFTIEKINEKTDPVQSQAGKVELTPGTYLLYEKDKHPKFSDNDSWNNIRLREFVAPKNTLDQNYVLHQPLQEISGGTDYLINADIISAEEPEKVELMYFSGNRAEFVPMERTSGYTYSITLPADKIRIGFLKYYIIVTGMSSGKTTFPCGTEGMPTDWDFNQSESYMVKVVNPLDPIYLFDAWRDFDQLSFPWDPGVNLMPSTDPDKAFLHIAPQSLEIEDAYVAKSMNQKDYSIRHFFGKKIKGRKQDVLQKTKLVIKGHSLDPANCLIQFALITRMGKAYGKVIQISSKNMDYVISFDDLKQVPLITLPRPYPTFLPYYFTSMASEFDRDDIETLQISIGPGMDGQTWQKGHGVAIESIRLE